MSAQRTNVDGSPQQRTERLKERVYVRFTGLAVVLTLQSHADETTAVRAAATLVIAVVGTLLAVLVADVLSHLAIHAAAPTRQELRHMLAVSVGSIGVLGLPLVCLAAAALDLWSTAAALSATALVLLATLAVVAYFAVRRLSLPLRYKVAALLAEVVLPGGGHRLRAARARLRTARSALTG